MKQGIVFREEEDFHLCRFDEEADREAFCRLLNEYMCDPMGDAEPLDEEGQKRLLEGMACPGGCVAGAGTIQAVSKSAAQVKAYAKKSPHKTADENMYNTYLDVLERATDGIRPEDAVAETFEAQNPVEPY